MKTLLHFAAFTAISLAGHVPLQSQPLSRVPQQGSNWASRWDTNAVSTLSGSLLSGIPDAKTGANVSQIVGADRFYSAGIFGQDTITSNIEPGHIWGGVDGHESLTHVTTFANHEAIPARIFDRHATAVAMVIGGRQGGDNPGPWQEGIAPQTDLRSGAVCEYWIGEAYSLDCFGTPEETIFAFETDEIGFGAVDVINTPAGDTAAANAFVGNDVYAMVTDGLAFENPRTTFVASAGNLGRKIGVNSVWSPASGYNNITVGALSNDDSNNYTSVARFSGRGPQAYGDPVNGDIDAGTARRAPVDLVAPGTDITSADYGGQSGGNDPSLPGSTDRPGNNLYDVFGGTSLSTPIVSGGVALMKSAARANALPEHALDTRVVKANLMNAAHKITGWRNGQRTHPNGQGGVLTTQALDYAAGAGALDLRQTYTQYLEGQTDIDGVDGGASDQLIGWDFAEVRLHDTTDVVLDRPLQNGSMFTATLTWFRERDYVSAETQVDVGYADLGLQVWDETFTTLYAESVSMYTPVEHLAFALPKAGSFGIRVIYPANVFGDISVASFALAWSGIAMGDFNGDGQLDVTDIDDLTAQSVAATHDPKYDMNGDQLVDAADVSVWVRDVLGSWIGDANLDGEFNSGDLVAVFTVGKYETSEQAGWSEGDWNADGEFGSGDLVVAFQDGGYELGTRPHVVAVPEPSTTSLIVLAAAFLVSTNCRRWWS